MEFFDAFAVSIASVWNDSGYAALTIGNIIMMAVGCVLLYLAIGKEYEPLLLIPIGFGIIVGNIPFAPGYQIGVYEEGSVLNYLYFGVIKGLYPPLIFLGIVFYMDIIGLILGKDFRSALGTVPVMLIAYMILGMLFNVSMWYKLSGQTKYAIIITLLGLGVTIVGNLIFMPLFSYWASVWVHLASCLAMLLLSAYLGQKYYPIPYKWKSILSYIAVGVALYLIAVGLQFGLEKITGRSATLQDTPMLIAKLTVNTILLGVFLVFLQKKTHILTSLRKR